MTKIEKTQMQVDVETYLKLIKLRKQIPTNQLSGYKIEPVRNVVKRLLDFYLENGGELPDQ